MWGKSKARRAFAVAAIPTLSVVAGVAGAAAQPIFQPTFSDSQLCVTVDMENALLQGPIDYTPTHAVDLPAGELVIPEAISWDEYPNREITPAQSSERWELQFLNADGDVIATSDAVPDIADGVRRAEFIGDLGSVTLPEPATAVRAHHRTDLPPNDTPNSVHVSGVTLCWEEAIAPPVCTDANGDVIDANADGTCPDDPPVCTDANGDAIDANADGTCPGGSPVCIDTNGEVVTNEDGSAVTPNDDGECPAPPVCLDDNGNEITAEADGSCPPDGPLIPQCVGDDGVATDPDADGSCPDPAPLGPIAEPTQPSPAQPSPTQPSPAQPQGDQLPITGSESLILLFSGMWLLAAGTTATAFVRTR